MTSRFIRKLEHDHEVCDEHPKRLHKKKDEEE
jgi:hypothetical protein